MVFVECSIMLFLVYYDVSYGGNNECYTDVLCNSHINICDTLCIKASSGGLSIGSRFGKPFHKSSFIFIVLYPLCIRKYNRVEHGFIIFSSIIIAYLGASFFEWLTTSLDLYEGYVNEERFDNMNHTAVFLGLLITLLIYLYAKLMGYFGQPQYGALVNINDVCIKKQSITLEYFCRISLIITIGLSIIGLTNNIMGRVSGYFSIVTLIIISAVLFNMRNSYMKIFVYGVIIFLYTAYFIVILLYRPDWNHLVPYEWGI